MSNIRKIRKPLPRMASVSALESLAIEGQDGIDWYARARVDIARVSGVFGLEPSHFAAVLSVLSPRVNVRRNAQLALRYCQRGSLDGVTSSVRAALAHYEATGEIRGPKTRAFAANLSGDETPVVLDVWMCRALGIEQRALKRKAVYRKGADRVRRVAVALGWTPAQTQAAIWTASYRRHYNVGNPPGLPLIEEARVVGVLAA